MVWRYTFNVLKEFIWSPTPKQEGSHVQIHGFELLPTYGNVMHNTACYRIMFVAALVEALYSLCETTWRGSRKSGIQLS